MIYSNYKPRTISSKLFFLSNNDYYRRKPKLTLFILDIALSCSSKLFFLGMITTGGNLNLNELYLYWIAPVLEYPLFSETGGNLN
jgi:hypothetical protein